ncbi:MAG: GNAT family N-acetyltransferase [Anaerolineae bacterium]|nr:GNAT family N-acetyltransferase [Anaerolineae bacterium]
MSFTIHPLRAEDRPWVRALLSARWGAPTVVAHGDSIEADTLPGFYARLAGEVAGLVTTRIAGDACEIVSLDSLHEGRGIGSALIAAVVAAARAAGCRRVWLVTTNDNLHALGFYQRRGFRLVAVHPGAVDAARKIKPQIPLIGLDNIPLHDELELTLALGE